ncbi:MAG: PF20097 family protein [Phycisphaerales bacterium]
MAKEPTCLVCEKKMEPGFIVDRGHGGSLSTPRWCADEPASSFWTGEVQASQLREGLKVVAFRCPECEALRLYAPAETTAR